MKYILIAIASLMLMFLIYKTQATRLSDYNRQQCAVYGYQADCHTKLK